MKIYFRVKPRIIGLIVLPVGIVLFFVMCRYIGIHKKEAGNERTC